MANSTIAINQDIKKKAQQKAKKYNMSLSTLVALLLNDYAQGKITIGIQPSPLTHNGFTQEQEREILEAAMDEEGSEEFDSMEEMIADLKKNHS